MPRPIPLWSLLLAPVLLLVWTIAPSGLAHAGAIERPFLMVRPGDVAALRERASQPPFAAIRANAAAVVANNQLVETATTAANVTQRATALNAIMSAAALCYVLETNAAMRQTYRARIIDLLGFWNPQRLGNLSNHYQLPNPPTGDWNYIVPTSAAFVQSLIGLDLIHDTLSAAQVQQFEDWLAIPGGFYTQRNLAWSTATRGARGVWALYRGDTTVAAQAIEDYLALNRGQMTDDGVFAEGPGYALARLMNPNREQKSTFGDMVARNDLIPDASWYGDRRLQLFQEWMNGYAFTPARRTWMIGDSSSQAFASWMGNPRRAARFSATAGAYETWLTQGIATQGRLATYVLTQPGAAARRAPSRIFPLGGAYFHQAGGPAAGSTLDLAGVLHNVRFEGRYHAHMHKEVNSVHLAGFGQTLMSGSGYAGWETPFQGFTFAYINRRAVSGNVALIDYEIERAGGTPFLPSAVNDHRDTEVASSTSSRFGGDGKFGSGVSGLVTGFVDLASGSTLGPRGAAGQLDALPNGNHQRHFFMVQPDDDVGGYFAAVDRIRAAADYVPLGASLAATTVWHPVGNQVVANAEESEYVWSIHNSSDVKLAILLATAPSRRRLYDGANTPLVVGRYLMSDYPMDADRVAQAVTVFFPFRQSGSAAAQPARPVQARLAGAGYSGATLQFGGGVRDLAIETRGSAVVTPLPGIDVRGTGVLLRQVAGALRWYAAAAARQLRVGSGGFQSNVDVTIAMRGMAGRILVPGGGAQVTFFAPQVGGLELDGTPVAGAALQPGRITATIPAGEHRVQLRTQLAVFANGFED